ncbi:MAG TPA: response regulator [Polyangiaceae bacterium]|jgi:CheY-like chemotaxis protein/class 3 adenylate cyclase|nr:response regulator [Polyangiaceae bacterium]
MHVGLVTPPGALGEFVARAVEPAGHQLCVAPSVDALYEQAETKPDVVVFAPIVEDRPAHEALSRARGDGLGVERALYLGLVPEDCARMQREGFARCLALPFQARDLLEALESSARGKLRVLLVDDSALIHKHTVPLLTAAGYDVSEAWDGAEALERLKVERADLVLTDVEMPRMDGYALCEALKNDPATEGIPVIICSSLGEASDLERGFDVGADDYLVKPVVPEELVSRLHSLLATRMLSGRERVLVVDDSAAIRHLVSDCLRRQGFVVTTAVDGQDGLEKAKLERPELVLTDYDMPRMNGFELVLGLRRDPATRDIPLVMLTARESKRDQAQMRAAGLTSYLVKPFGPDKCVAIVERVLAESRLARYKEASRLYISEGAVQAAEQLSRGGSLGDIRAREMDATLLFSDISGFTNMSSKMTPAEVVAILNEAFDSLCIVIKDFGGDIDKFIGDAIMAVFEARSDFDQSHELRAARAAWGMQRSLDVFNAKKPHEAPLVMRIGLNCGPVVRGDIGSRFVRRDYTCIGDVVNRAQRHESKAPLGGVLLSRDLYHRIADQVIVEEMPGITLKGIDEPVSAYILKGFPES